MAYAKSTHRLLARADVLVEQLGTFDADKVQAALLRDCGRKQRLSAPRVAVQQQPVRAQRRASANGGQGLREKKPGGWWGERVREAGRSKRRKGEAELRTRNEAVMETARRWVRTSSATRVSHAGRASCPAGLRTEVLGTRKPSDAAKAPTSDVCPHDLGLLQLYVTQRVRHKVDLCRSEVC